MSCQSTDLLKTVQSNAFDQSRSQFRAEYNQDGKLLYLGHADASKSEDQTGWIIQKFTYDEKGCVLRNHFPGTYPNTGNSYPNHKWSERANYEYV